MEAVGPVNAITRNKHTPLAQGWAGGGGRAGPVLTDGWWELSEAQGTLCTMHHSAQMNPVLGEG